ncbi:MAG: iron complex outermembrane receptor protein, partial [Gammaproteobacteria bacterium]
ASGEIEEVVVTATKRAESMQDVPIAISALTEESMDQLGISNFTDYMMQLPGITAGGSGPGQNTIYIRGVASTTPNLTTAGVAGLAPNVALYLDEQPLSQPGRNLDVYAADLARIETLSGPQGTLFGASSQAGTVRLITNKPDPSETYGNMKFGTGFTEGGEMSANVTGMINIPVADNFTLRAVVYVDNQGGYIDNVAGTRDLSGSARFRSAGTVRDNGSVVSAGRAGFQAGQDLSGVTFIAADNSARAEKNFNETTYTGGRISGLWDINDNLSLLVAHARQDVDSDGVFFADPTLSDDLAIERFEDDSIEDKYHNTNWTLTGAFDAGRMGELEVVYTGAYTDRETDQNVDYTDYLFVGQYLPYYICDSTVSYPVYNNFYPGFTQDVPGGTCQAPNLLVKSRTRTEVMTHEIRVSTDASNRWRATAGGFYSDLELKERNDFTYPGSVNPVVFGSPGFSSNSPQTTGFISDPGPFPSGVIFRNDIKRTDEQYGIFGEMSYDFNDQFSATFGARYYDIGVDFDGSANSSFCNGFQADANAFGTDISDLYNGDGEFEFIGTCDTTRHTVYNDTQSIADIQGVDPALSLAQATAIFNATRAPNKAKTSGVIFKGTFTWTPTGDQLYYATYSEGFRPGLLNRPGGATNPAGTFTVPFVLDTDEITNYEFGWKSSYLNNTLRFNGSLFYVEIDKLQTTIFDPSVVNLFFSDNAANAEILGLEGDIIWTPESIDGLTIFGAFSILDTKITEVLTPTNDVRKGDELAFAPDYQGNLRARYEWNLSDSGLTAHFMPNISFSAKSFSDIVTINRDEIDSWVMGGLTAGVTGDKWGAELYVNNITDKRAEIARNFVFDTQQVTYVRPRTIGVRVNYNF